MRVCVVDFETSLVCARHSLDEELEADNNPRWRWRWQDGREYATDKDISDCRLKKWHNDFK